MTLDRGSHNSVINVRMGTKARTSKLVFVSGGANTSFDGYPCGKRSGGGHLRKVRFAAFN